MVHVVTDESFEKEVVQSEIPCLVEFTAGWCTVCKLMEPTLEELSERFAGEVKFCTVDTDTEKALRIRFAVAVAPYLVFIADGMQTPLFDELVTAERLEERICFVLDGGEAPTTRPL